MGDEKAGRKVTLSVRMLTDLYFSVMAAVGVNRAYETRIKAAERKLTALLDVTYTLEGIMAFGKQDSFEKIDAEFSDLELFGFKLALVQAIAGNGRDKGRASHGRINRFLLPLASELGIARLVEKESALPEEAAEKLVLTFDDAEVKADKAVDEALKSE